MPDNSTCPRCGQPLVAGLCPSCPGAATAPPHVGGFSALFLALAIYLLVIVAALGVTGYRMYRGRPFFRSHGPSGPVARPDQLQGDGVIDLVQIGPHAQPYALDSLAAWLHAKYGVKVRVLAPLPAFPEAWNSNRRQYQAQALLNALRRAEPHSAPNDCLIGFTDADLYNNEQTWTSSFTQRDNEHTAIISSDGMGDAGLLRRLEPASVAKTHLVQHLQSILLRDVAVLHWHFAIHQQPGGVLASSFDPEAAESELYDSDVAPERTPQGNVIDEPCFFFEFSARNGLRLHPGTPIRSCADVNDPVIDSSRETFELALRIGLLIDKHTDVYLPGVVPIAVERVTRDGWKGLNPLGISGTINYNEYLSSADNIRINVVRADGVSRALDRRPRYGADLAHSRYVDVESPGLQQLRWVPAPYEHYELHNFDGAVKSYLPCLGPSLWCYLTDDRDFQGRQLRFQRGADRRLLSLDAPGGVAAHLDYDGLGRIAAVSGSDGTIVRYSYDEANRLVSVAYPSGAVFRYDYDTTQHLLSFSVAASPAAPPHIWMRNEYVNGLLARQQIDGSGTYTYSYNSADPRRITVVTVDTPDGRHYDLQFNRGMATVRERAIESAASR